MLEPATATATTTALTLAVTLALVLPGVAHADQPSGMPSNAPAISPDGDIPRGASLEWSPAWPRFRWWEYGGTLALGLTMLGYESQADFAQKPRFTGGIGFDGAIRGWLRAETLAGRARAAKVSDVLWMGGMAVPILVDLPLALIAHRRPEVAWQMLMMDLQAFAVAGLINRVAEIELARGRPSLGECAANPGYDPLCGSVGLNASLPSGHTLGIATAAGLTCVHHRYLPLLGAPWADAGACALMSVATFATAAGRVIADRHHATDVLVGGALGFTIGYGLPWLLHYRHGGRAVYQEGKSGERGTSVLMPLAGPGMLGLGLAGTLR